MASGVLDGGRPRRLAKSITDSAEILDALEEA